MDVIGSNSFDLDLGRRIFIIIFFLFSLWFVLSYFANKVRNGEMDLPEFLKSKLGGADRTQNKEIYQFNIIQRKPLPDGSELLVLDVSGRHILLSKHIQSGINYITELNDED